MTTIDKLNNSENIFCRNLTFQLEDESHYELWKILDNESRFDLKSTLDWNLYIELENWINKW